MITSTSNQRVKDLVALQKKSKIRQQERSFLVEGLKMLREVPKDRLSHLYISESFRKHQSSALGDIRITEVLSDTVFSYISDTKTPQGILGVVRMLDYSLSDIITSTKRSPSPPFLLILEGIQDPGNLGTIMRSAEAAGVTGIILNTDCVDIYNPKVIRSTMGSVFRVPFVYEDNLVSVVKELSQAKIRSFATDLAGSVSYQVENYTQGVAIFIGNESKGLSSELSDAADAKIHIPMCGQVESLNAAMATTIVAFEVKRQRDGGTACN